MIGSEPFVDKSKSMEWANGIGDDAQRKGVKGSLDPLAKNGTDLGLWSYRKLLAEAARAAPRRPRHGREGTRTALRMHQGLMLRNWGEV